MRPSTSSTGRTSDVYATSKWIWGFGRRITDSEVIDRDAVEVAPRIPRHRCPGNSVRAVDLDRDGRAARNPPVCRRHPRARADGDALVRPLLFTFLIVWLGGVMGSAWYFVRFLPPTAALGVGATPSTVVAAVRAPLRSPAV